MRGCVEQKGTGRRRVIAAAQIECWRCGGAHRIADCLEALLEKPSKGRKNDKARKGDSGSESRERHLAIVNVPSGGMLRPHPGIFRPHLPCTATMESLDDSCVGDTGYRRAMLRGEGGDSPTASAKCEIAAVEERSKANR